MYDICLNGTWQYFLDTGNITGKTIEKITDVNKLDRTLFCREICIPSCWETQEEDKTFDGPAWFRKTFYAECRDKEEEDLTRLHFEGVSYYCEVYLNGEYIGCHEGQWDGFEFDITRIFKVNDTNELILKVYKQGYSEESKFHFRETLSGFIPDVSCTFGGIWRDIWLKRTGEAYVGNVFTKPDICGGCVGVYANVVCGTDVGCRTDAGCRTNADRNISMKMSVLDKYGAMKGNKTIEISTGEIISTTISLDDYELWEPENPCLYTLDIKLRANGKLCDTKAVKFGMRDVHKQDNHILLNGKPVYLRGILHWGYNDKIAPNPGREDILKEIREVKRLGFNLIKFCLFIPSTDYLYAADEEGILTWIEFPLWLPRVTEFLLARMREQYRRILFQVRNHPSIMFYSLGCELNSEIGAEILDELYQWIKSNACSCLVRDNSGSGECYGGLADDFADFYDYHFYSDLNFLEPLLDIYTADWREKRPWLFGEFCDADTFRPPSEPIERNNGQKPWWMMDDKRDIRDRAGKLAALSVKQAMIHRKYTLEAVRSYPEITGYVITSIRDCPITTSGIFNDRGQSKFDSEEFSMINSTRVLVLRRDIRTKWKNGGNRVHYNDDFNFFEGELIRLYPVLSNYSNMDFKNGTVMWKLLSEKEEILLKGVKDFHTTAVKGNVTKLCAIEFEAPRTDKTMKVLFECVFSVRGFIVKNKWHFWIYPDIKPEYSIKAALYDPGNLFGDFEACIGKFDRICMDESGEYSMVTATRLDRAVIDYAARGGKVFLVQRGKEGFPVKEAPFWRECMKEFASHYITDGLCHGGITDVQFMGMSTDTVFLAREIPEYTGGVFNYRSLMKRIDCRNYSVSDYIIELRSGSGIIIATTLRLEGGAGRQPSCFSSNTGAVYLARRIIEYLNQTGLVETGGERGNNL